MTLWTSSLFIFLLLLYAVPGRAQTAGNNAEPMAIPLTLTKRDREVTQAYADVFKILSDENPCSSFYGGPRTATTVLNNFMPAIESHRLTRDVTFLMSGRPRLLQEPLTGTSYRLFEKVTVNTNSSFYQRRIDAILRFPSDVGRYPPGTRPARALILLHELGHLIQGQNGDWLIPDDGFNDAQSQQHTLRIQQACRAQLQLLM
jgi:hypothetical protein